jgi:hypothetical protein
LSITVDHGEKIDQVTLNTNLRSIGPCGGPGGSTNVAQGPPGTRLSYITGKSGELVDQLTFYFVDNALL